MSTLPSQTSPVTSRRASSTSHLECAVSFFITRKRRVSLWFSKCLVASCMSHPSSSTTYHSPSVKVSSELISGSREEGETHERIRMLDMNVDSRHSPNGLAFNTRDLSVITREGLPESFARCGKQYGLELVSLRARCTNHMIPTVFSRPTVRECAVDCRSGKESDGSPYNRPDKFGGHLLSKYDHQIDVRNNRCDSALTRIMPRTYESCNPQVSGVIITDVLTELILVNDRLLIQNSQLTRFHSRSAPNICIADYLQRLIRHAKLSPQLIHTMIFYIDHLCEVYPKLTINSLIVHRLLITAATVASKFLSDFSWTNAPHAWIAGISAMELAILELEFLQKARWKIVPKPETLVDCCNSILDFACNVGCQHVAIMPTYANVSE